MPVMQVFYADQFVLPLPPGHRFPMAKYQLLRDRLAAELPEIAAACRRRPRRDGELALVHTPGLHPARSRDGSVDAKLMREIGFPWSEAMAERARRSVGATIAACRAAFADGVAANIAGGTHHAYADKGGGFCVFNDAAVAARLMQAEWARAHAARAAAGGDRRPRRAPGQRHGPHLPRRPHRVHAVAARPEELSRSARRRATSTSTCPTAAATTTTCTRWSARSTNWSSASSPAW